MSPSQMTLCNTSHNDPGLKKSRKFPLPAFWWLLPFAYVYHIDGIAPGNELVPLLFSALFLISLVSFLVDISALIFNSYIDLRHKYTLFRVCFQIYIQFLLPI